MELELVIEAMVVPVVAVGVETVVEVVMIEEVMVVGEVVVSRGDDGEGSVV